MLVAVTDALYSEISYKATSGSRVAELNSVRLTHARNDAVYDFVMAAGEDVGEIARDLRRLLGDRRRGTLGHNSGVVPRLSS